MKANHQRNGVITQHYISLAEPRQHQRRGREGERRGRHEFQWIITNAATSSSASFTQYASSSAQSQNGYADEWDQSRRGRHKEGAKQWEKYKMGISITAPLMSVHRH